MAKSSTVLKNKRRAKLVESRSSKRAELKAKIYDKSLSLQDRFALVMKLASMPRNSSRIRIRNRCELTGRPRGYYRKFALSRIMIRELAGKGMITGLVKSSC